MKYVVSHAKKSAEYFDKSGNHIEKDQFWLEGSANKDFRSESFFCDITRIKTLTKLSTFLILLKSKYIFNFMLIRHMRLHMWLNTRRILTVLTTKWFFSSMDHYMSFHITGRFHNFLTKWATKLLGTKVNRSSLKSKISDKNKNKLFWKITIDEKLLKL